MMKIRRKGYAKTSRQNSCDTRIEGDNASNLRYYATLKVRKFESLIYKINTRLQKTTTCIGLLAEQILSVNI